MFAIYVPGFIIYFVVDRLGTRLAWESFKTAMWRLFRSFAVLRAYTL